MSSSHHPVARLAAFVLPAASALACSCGEASAPAQVPSSENGGGSGGVAVDAGPPSDASTDADADVDADVPPDDECGGDGSSHPVGFVFAESPPPASSPPTSSWIFHAETQRALTPGSTARTLVEGPIEGSESIGQLAVFTPMDWDVPNFVGQTFGVTVHMSFAECVDTFGEAGIHSQVMLKDEAEALLYYAASVPLMEGGTAFFSTDVFPGMSFSWKPNDSECRFDTAEPELTIEQGGTPIVLTAKQKRTLRLGEYDYDVELGGAIAPPVPRRCGETGVTIIRKGWIEAP